MTFLKWSGAPRAWLTLILLTPAAAQIVTAQTGKRPQSWSDELSVVANRKSPGVRLHSVPVRAVKLGRGFWTERIENNKKQSLPSLFKLLEENGVVDNFRRVSGRKKVERRGPLYTDSDLYKWMEAVALTLHSGPEPALKKTLDRMTDEIAAAQDKNGYLNTHYSMEREDKRFTDFRTGHELYCLGHLLQAGIAYYRATGERRLLDIGIRFADHAAATLGPGKKSAFAGHPEVEMALIELYRTTGERRYLEFADYLLNADRPELKLRESDIRYTFSGVPFNSREKFEGHSVRAMYAASGATDYYSETRDAATLATLGRLWRDLVDHKMYLTGSVGSREAGEAIGEPFELPNEQAYTETCAAIGNYMWNWRMLAVTGDARHASTGERALYNGVLSGVSLAGDLYFYRNPLSALGRTERKPWYTTTCCPPNIQRTLASLPGYFYSTDAKGLWVHLYHNSELDWRTEADRKLRVTQRTEYPWQNKVELSVTPESTEQFSLFLRIPDWCRSARVAVNGGEEQTINKPDSYYELSRAWKAGDRVTLTLEMPVRLVTANPRVRENFGRVAVQRGPLVYCLEGIGDDAGGVSPFDLALLIGDGDAAQSFTTKFEPDLLGGVTTIEAEAVAAARPSAGAPLYGVFDPSAGKAAGDGRRVRVRLIPYYSWANRGPSEMEVWLPWTRRS